MKTERPVVLVGDTGIVRGGVKCQGCKGIATRLDDEASLRLRGGDEWLIPPAFECPRCQAIIFEEEFDKGLFVPPQFRMQDVPQLPRERGEKFTPKVGD